MGAALFSGVAALGVRMFLTCRMTGGDVADVADVATDHH
jgi:hypothetical protein